VTASMSSRVWFITGTSRGFGRIWAQAALERGDRVAATARDITAIQPLADKYGAAVLPMTLDITDATADRVSVERAFDHFGATSVLRPALMRCACGVELVPLLRRCRECRLSEEDCATTREDLTGPALAALFSWGTGSCHGFRDSHHETGGGQ
jgi:NAD(P)-dependent dehydrogenase (short-subunit alcohol dehydrogenase family)